MSVRTSVGRAAPSCLGTRHSAGRIEGPIAIKANDAPFHAPARPDQAGIFPERVVDGMLESVSAQRYGRAETPGNCVWRTGPVGGLGDFFKARDAKLCV